MTPAPTEAATEAPGTDEPCAGSGAEEPCVRRPGRPRDVRADAAIVEAAVEILVEEGFAGVTVDAVAARAGVGKATIYRRWRSKEDLLADAARSLTAVDSFESTGDLRGDLHEMFGGLVRTMRDTAVGRIAPELVAEATRNPEIRRVLDVISAERRIGVRGLLEAAVARGEVRSELDVETVIDMLVGPTFYRMLVLGTAPDEQRDFEVVDAVLDGVLRR